MSENNKILIYIYYYLTIIFYDALDKAKMMNLSKWQYSEKKSLISENQRICLIEFASLTV